MGQKPYSLATVVLLLFMECASFVILRELNIQFKAYTKFIESLPEIEALKVTQMIEPNDHIRWLLVFQALLLTRQAFLP